MRIFKNYRFLRSLFVFSVFETAVLLFYSPAIAGEPVKVCVSILPQKYFVQQIGRELVDIQVMVPPGAGPATYEPRPGQMTSLATTKIYFSIGVPFEKAWLDNLSGMNPDMKIFHTDGGIQKRLLEKHTHPESSTQVKDKHDHATTPGTGHSPDPHIWLSPPLVMMQARVILLALQQVDPDNRERYEKNYRAFISKLVDVDERLRKLLDDTRVRQFLVFHPAWGYFADAYGLTQIPVEIEGKAPKPAQLVQIIDYARQLNLASVFAQPQFSTRYAEQVARAIGGRVIIADPLSFDWENNLLDIAEKIKTAPLE